MKAMIAKSNQRRFRADDYPSHYPAYSKAMNAYKEGPAEDLYATLAYIASCAELEGEEGASFVADVGTKVTGALEHFYDILEKTVQAWKNAEQGKPYQFPPVQNRYSDEEENPDGLPDSTLVSYNHPLYEELAEAWEALTSAIPDDKVFTWLDPWDGIQEDFGKPGGPTDPSDELGGFLSEKSEAMAAFSDFKEILAKL